MSVSETKTKHKKSIKHFQIEVARWNIWKKAEWNEKLKHYKTESIKKIGCKLMGLYKNEYLGM
jgi:hypothetical protein